MFWNRLDGLHCIQLLGKRIMIIIVMIIIVIIYS